MPGWLQAIATVNPLSDEADLLRALMVPDVPSAFGAAVDVAVLTSAAVGLVVVGSRVYPRVAR